MSSQINFSVGRSLSDFNRSLSEMSKTFSRVTSGQKINSAADGAAELAISEKMLKKIRGLYQDKQNVQNGSALIKTAQDGVNYIVDALREMRKKAVDAANESNTDEDRAVLQKEIDQLRSSINDVALTTQYNGKPLLTGVYALNKTTTKVHNGWLEPPHDYLLKAGETYIKTVNVDGSRSVIGKIIGINKVKDLMTAFEPADSTVQQASNLLSGMGFYADFGYDGKTSSFNWSEQYQQEKFTYKDTIQVYFENTENNPSSPQQVIRAFVYSLDEHVLSNVSAFDEAINYCTGGTITDKNTLVTQFMNDLNGAASYEDFLRDYCDIDLNNIDTGAITGSDAGGGSIKTAESVVPESSSPASWTIPTSGTPTTKPTAIINGLTVQFPLVGANKIDFTPEENYIMAGLNSEWIAQSLDLIKETYGIDFNDRDASVKNLTVEFKNEYSNNIAYVTYGTSTTGKTSSLTLNINMNYCSSIDMNSANGELPSSGTVTYLDRIVAHELTRAVMATNIDYFNDLPYYVREGAAELTHGADDGSKDKIISLLTDRKSTLQSILDSGGSQSNREDSYAAGYMLLRYLAKQGQGNSISEYKTEYEESYLQTTPKGKEIGVEVDFSNSYMGDGTPIEFPYSFHKQSFCILCGGCQQYINITFDKEMDIGTSTLRTFSDNTARKDYIIGIGGAENENDLARAIFEGVANAPRSSTDKSNDVYVVDADGNEELVCVCVDNKHNLRIAKNPNYPDSSSSEYIFLKDYTPAMLFKEGGIIDAIGGEGSKDDAPAGVAKQELDDDGNEVFDEYGNKIPHIQKFTVSEDRILNIWDPKYKNLVSGSGTPIVIHSGTLSNQNTYYYINDMQTKSLTGGKIFDPDLGDERSWRNLIKESDIDRFQTLRGDTKKQRDWIDLLKDAENLSINYISVTNVRDANLAIRVLDGALEYALDTATTLGAYLQRLDSTEDYVVTTKKNTILSESVIRDADMATEMTRYARTAFLTKSSQAMLVQANQKASDVLFLTK